MIQRTTKGTLGATEAWTDGRYALTAWSLKVAEYEHQFKVIDQKIFVVRETMPKEIKLEFLTGPRKFDEIMEKLEIIVNEMMADDGPT